jgi:mRNA interferase RelE/StbE
MKWRLSWMPEAGNDLKRLPGKIADRIVTKMDWYVVQDQPLRFAKRLTDPLLGTYRFRIGDYRVLCDVRRGEISVLEVLAVRNRKSAYREV